MIELPTTDSVEDAVADSETETTIGQILVAAYPGYTWHIDASKRNGVVKIINMELSSGPGARPWGFILHLNRIATASELVHKVTMAGGEILERYRQYRGAIRVDHVDSAPHDWRGQIIGDVH